MRLTVTIETGNAAFEPDPNQETARILRKLAQNIDAELFRKGPHLPPDLENVDGHKLRDLNGNTVGQVEVEQGSEHAPRLTQLHMTSERDHETAKEIATRLGYRQTAYTSTSALVGLECFKENPKYMTASERATLPKITGYVVKTKEFGFMFIATLEDLNMYDLYMQMHAELEAGE